MRGTSILMLAGVLLIAACTPAAVVPVATDTPVPATTEPPMDTEEPAPLDTQAPAPAVTEEQAPSNGLDGAALLQDRCTECHSLGRVESASKTAEQWEATVNRMVGHGATLTPEELDALVQYLAQTYP